MVEFDLKTGDVFAVASGSMQAKTINVISGFNSPDGESSYNHAGIILSPIGHTFEARRTLGRYMLKDYLGRQIIIARPKADESTIYRVLRELTLEHHGQLYPFWRIPLHIHPSLARLISYEGRYLVCSELTAKYEFGIGIRHNGFTGTSPDRLVDEWRYWKAYDIIFEGLLVDNH